MITIRTLQTECMFEITGQIPIIKAISFGDLQSLQTLVKEGPLVVSPYAELLICCYMWDDNTMVQLVCSMHRDGVA